MKYLLVQNSLNTVPATFQSANQFRATFNQVVELPANCQMCIVSSTFTDANAPKIHYVELTNVPLQAIMGNGEKGGEPKILGPVLTNSEVYGTKNWVDLDNPAPLIITDLYVKLTNQDGELSSGLSAVSELLIGYRAKGNVVNTQ